MTKENILMTCVTVGMLLIAAAMVIPIVVVMNGHYLTSPLYKYLYAAGAALVLIGRVFNRYKGNDTRMKQLFKIETWGAIFLCVGAFFLFYSQDGQPQLRDTLAFTLAGSALQIYTAIMIPRRAKKSEEEK